MFMRFVRIKVKSSRKADYRRFYDDRIITALETTPG